MEWRYNHGVPVNTKALNRWGMKYEQIDERLVISINTVRFYIKEIYSKLQCFEIIEIEYNISEQ